jgi:hypothetical protein
VDIFGSRSTAFSVAAKAALAACALLTSVPLARAIDQYNFVWNMETDEAPVKTQSGGRDMWRGRMLPALWISSAQGSKQFVRAEVASLRQEIVSHRFSDVATGELTIRHYPEGIRFERLAVNVIFGAYISAPSSGYEASLNEYALAGKTLFGNPHLTNNR